MTAPDAAWTARPRTISVLVDNDSWILPYAERLVAEIAAGGDRCQLVRRAEDVPEGLVCFLLGCTRIVGPEILARNAFTLVVHESDLPLGRGFAPLAWQVLEGRDEIPVCLVEATEEADAGVIHGRRVIALDGTELSDVLRARQGETTLALCHAFLSAPERPQGRPQTGTPSTYPRRRPADSRIDPDRSIAAQFDLLRVVDNRLYPAFFDHRGRRYRLTIEEIGPAAEGGDGRHAAEGGDGRHAAEDSDGLHIIGKGRP